VRAWRLDGLGGAFTLEDVPVPQVRPGGVLVRVEASTLMSYMKGYVEGRLPAYRVPDHPFTPGGNGVGVIEAVGADVWQLHVGQRVMISPLFTSAERVLEPTQMLLGVSAFDDASMRAQADWPDGTLADYALLPASCVVPVDPALAHLPAERLAVTSRFVVPYGGLVRGRLAAGETLIVTGATGTYGSAAVMVALAMGAGRVIAAGRNRDRLADISAMGGHAVTPVILTGKVDEDAAHLRTAASGGADMGFDMVGGATNSNATVAALKSLRRGGRLVLMGSMTVDLPVPYVYLMLNSLEIIGNFMHPADAYSRVLALVRAGRLDLQSIIPRSFALSQLPSAMDAAATTGGNEAAIILANNSVSG
jgi:alcohol dehydrogenase